MKDKKNIILIVSIIIISLMCIAGFSYAFFVSEIIGNDLAEDMEIISGKIELTFEDSNNVLSLPNARPGDKKDKTFIVENTGTSDKTYKYNIKLTELNVTFQKEDLVYTLQEYTDDSYTSQKDDGVNVSGFINAETVNENGEMILVVDKERPPKGTKHYYKITIEFKSLDNVNQNYNQNAEFNGKINIATSEENTSQSSKPQLFSEIMKVDNETIFNDDPGNNLRYVGKDPNNYIWFNCDSYDELTQKKAEIKCEKWRIIGLFNNIVKSEGGAENLVKIIKPDGIKYKQLAWNSANTNNWTGSDLQESLNGAYLNSEDIGDWLSDVITADSYYKSITAPTKGMIEQVTWNIGGKNPNSKTISASEWYTYERGTETWGSQPNTWDGYVALMYPSDYAYATSGLKDNPTTNREGCLNGDLKTWYNGDYATNCAANSWLLNGEYYEWTLTQDTNSSAQVVGISSGGGIVSSFTWVANSRALLRQTLYLKSNVKIASGNGTSETPYILIQDN